MAEHRFGAAHTAVKLEALAKYLPAYTTALKNQHFWLHYIDAFAGTGTCHIQAGDKRLRIPGSASIALDCRPPFHRITFIETKKRHVDALRRLVDATQRDSIHVLHDDANVAIPQTLRWLDAKRDRAVVFLDPYGMAVDWQTLKSLAESELADVWYLFPISGLYRQAARDAADIDDDKARALNRMLGTEDWRKDFYVDNPQIDMWNTGPREIRAVDWREMATWVHALLGKIFPWVAPPKMLYLRHGEANQGPPLFALFFCVSNPSPKAIALAKRLVGDILRD